MFQFHAGDAFTDIEISHGADKTRGRTKSTGLEVLLLELL
jgi:hypothetical protein